MAGRHEKPIGAKRKPYSYNPLTSVDSSTISRQWGCIHFLLTTFAMLQQPDRDRVLDQCFLKLETFEPSSVQMRQHVCSIGTRQWVWPHAISNLHSNVY